MVGVRRVGYFISLTLMILGILAIPFGIVLGIGGFVASIDDGDTEMFGAGVALTITGIITFIVCLVLSIILKKSGDDNKINLIVSKSDAQSILNQRTDAKLGAYVKKEVEGQSLGKLESAQDNNDTMTQNKHPQLRSNLGTADSESADIDVVDFSDMLQDLLEERMGDTSRLEYISKRLENNRSIYNSDRQYVEREFKKLRDSIQSGD
ncbi:MAG: hypothetical protein OXC46_03290 [Thaumarchaeota archaeon]|nr:hypothetical protein [Nitrososphaerota archaeon]